MQELKSLKFENYYSIIPYREQSVNTLRLEQTFVDCAEFWKCFIVNFIGKPVKYSKTPYPDELYIFYKYGILLAASLYEVIHNDTRFVWESSD